MKSSKSNPTQEAHVATAKQLGMLESHLEEIDNRRETLVFRIQNNEPNDQSLDMEKSAGEAMKDSLESGSNESFTLWEFQIW